MKIGIVGTGAMGQNHLRVVHGLPELTLACALDTDRDALARATAPYAVPAAAGLEEVAAGCDAVMIATPTVSHHELARFFLQRGRHVLVEKPICETLAQADELIAMAAAERRVLAVGHLERFNPVVQFACRHVDQPRFIDVQRLGSFSPRSLDIDVVLDLMIHDLDIIRQWDRSGVAEIRAVGVPVISERTDIANVRLQFRSGLVATLTASRVSQQKTRTLRLFQRNLYLSLDYVSRQAKVLRLQGRELQQETPQVDHTEPLRLMWQAFAAAVGGGPDRSVSGADGRAALALALQITAAIAAGERAGRDGGRAD